jgi:lipopolysaccharide/colanic/teichoic acid biosynthesis glycosyltransferase
MYRFFDLFFLFLFSIPIILLFFITFLLCVFFQGKPIFFSQKRGGFKNKEITIYKFRSMKKIKNKMQATPLGKFLRKYKLDEIPQFYSILIGELSIVGPRPLHYEYKNIYNKKQKKRFLVNPGLTGYTQVFLKNNDTWTKKFNYDIWYVENKNLILDLKILIKTFFNIAFKYSDEKIPKKFNGRN